MPYPVLSEALQKAAPAELQEHLPVLRRPGRKDMEEINEQTNPWPELMHWELYSHSFGSHLDWSLLTSFIIFSALRKDKDNVPVLRGSKSTANTKIQHKQMFSS